MSSPSSSSPRFGSSSPWLVGLVGLIAGLALGLIIGWWLWPVEWTGGTVADLPPAQRANYVSAVADAYVMYSDSDAALEAARRLEAFGERLPDEVLNALEYFQVEDPANAVRTSNIARLAGALGVPVDATDLILPTPAPPQVSAGVPAVAPATEPAATEPAGAGPGTGAAAPAQESGGGMSVLRWLLVTIGALLFIGGGLALIYTLVRRSAAQGTDGAAADDFGTPAPAAATAAAAAARSSRVSAAPDIARPYTPRFPAEEDDLRFDDDYDDGVAVAHGRLPDDDLLWTPETVGEVVDDSADDTIIDGEFEEIEVEEAQRQARAALAYDSQVDAVDAADEPADADVELPFGPDVEDDEADGAGAELEAELDASDVQAAGQYAEGDFDAPWQSAAVVAGAAGAGRGGRPPQPRRLLARYTFTYQAGVADYAESQPVVDPDTARYLGECGMGVSDENKALRDEEGAVVALDVYLFDKFDQENIDTRTQVLLSRYGEERDYGQAFEQRKGLIGPALTPQPGTRFTVAVNRLVLEGEVAEVVYTGEGLFQKVRVNLAVSSS